MKVLSLMLLFLPFFSIKSFFSAKTPVVKVSRTGAALHTTREGRWSFQLYSRDIIKTSFQPDGYSTNEQVSNAVILQPLVKKVTVSDTGNVIDLGEDARVLIDEDAFSYQFDEDTSNVAAEYFTRDEFRGFRFRLREDEQFFGGGERAIHQNRRGYRLSLYNAPAYGYGEGAENLNYSVPFIISSKGYGIFFDNASRGYLDIGKSDPGVLEAGFISGELTFYIIHGKNTDEILRHYTELVGRQPLPPRWVLGNLMSRFGYRSEEQLLNTVARMQSENFPLDAVVLDLFWFGDSIKHTLGNLDWVNRERWPDPPKMIRDLQAQGIKTILITEPYVLEGTRNYAETIPFHSVDSAGHPYTLTSFYFGNGGLLDMYRKDSQDWFWGKYKKQVDLGVAGWWGDLGEPETHPHDMFHNLRDLGFKRLFRSEEVHNVYGHYWDKMVFDKYQKEVPGVRLFHLNRSGFAGSQRYSIFPWSGDVGRNWSGFRAQLPLMLGMSLSGVPYIHADAGGFAMGEKDPELYTRWLQFASFTPVFRPHGTALEDLDSSVANIESEPVFYPDPYKSIVRKYIQLRYSLLPYNYTLAYEQAKDGKPLTRPMFYYSSEDPELLKADGQYMWGDNILVAPVTERGAAEKRVYLPGGKWYKFFTNAPRQGGQWIDEPVDLENIPVYVKAGSFIPTRNNLANTEQYQSDSLHVTYYPDSTGSSYLMYDDDGKSTTSLEKNRYELIRFNAAVEGRKISIKVSSNGGNFDKRPAHRTMILAIPALGHEPAVVKLNGQALKVDPRFDEDRSHSYLRAVWDPIAAVLYVIFQFSGNTEQVDIQQ